MWSQKSGKERASMCRIFFLPARDFTNPHIVHPNASVHKIYVYFVVGRARKTSQNGICRNVRMEKMHDKIIYSSNKSLQGYRMCICMCIFCNSIWTEIEKLKPSLFSFNFNLTSHFHTKYISMGNFSEKPMLWIV